MEPEPVISGVSEFRTDPRSYLKEVDDNYGHGSHSLLPVVRESGRRRLRAPHQNW